MTGWDQRFACPGVVHPRLPFTALGADADVTSLGGGEVPNQATGHAVTTGAVA